MNRTFIEWLHLLQMRKHQIVRIDTECKGGICRPITIIENERGMRMNCGEELYNFMKILFTYSGAGWQQVRPEFKHPYSFKSYKND